MKTTNSPLWMRKHPNNLLIKRKACRPEGIFVRNTTYVESDQGVHYLFLITETIQTIP
ncbi:hypothetical protein [Thalassospira alkalitolerans]|uniref:hypothetical protein n=1 Tax=Thalassospira alkalitolerans TaxID=1293890 RepID=UPI003AA7E123